MSIVRLWANQTVNHFSFELSLVLNTVLPYIIIPALPSLDIDVSGLQTFKEDYDFPFNDVNTDLTFLDDVILSDDKC